LLNSFVLEAVDVLDPQVQDHLKKLIVHGFIVFIHFGTPCSSFSLARKKDGGPPPLRDQQHLWGLPHLSDSDRQKVLMGNKFMQFTADIIQLCHSHGVGWSLENPAGSFLWSMPPIVEIAQLSGVRRFELDMCRFGSEHKKPTAILSSADLGPVALCCDRDTRPHNHEPLTGMVEIQGAKVFRTKLAQVYPAALCELWADTIVAKSSDPLFATFGWSQASGDRKRPVGQAVPWKAHKQQLTAQKAVAAGYQLKRSAMPPLLQTEMEPGTAVHAALDLVHPFTKDPALEPDLQEALAMVVFHPHKVLGHREGALAFWSAQAHYLLPETDRELSFVRDPHLRRLLRGVPDGQPLQLGTCTHVALWRHMLAAAHCVDQRLVDDLLFGFPIVGDIQRSQRWPLLIDLEDALSESELCERAWEFSSKVIKNVNRSAVTEHTAKVWEATMEDVEEKVTLGPFFSRQEVDEILGVTDWIPTQRFEVVQKNKVRGVDSATTNGINMASRIMEKLELPSTDVNVAALRWLRSNVSEDTNLQGWVLDERKAYRQIPIRPDHRRWSMISLKEPTTGNISFFVMIGHSFGLVAAVSNYNRRSAAITDILRRLFWVAAFNFYDDKYGFETVTTCGSAHTVAQKVHWWLGAQFDRKKLQLCSDPTILGVTYDLAAFCLRIKPSRKEELTSEIDTILEVGLLPPGQAGKLRGKLMFGASQLWGKIGRAFLRVLSERQYSSFHRSDLNKALVLALHHWRTLISDGPPRPISLLGARPADFVIFTDGSFPDGTSALLKPWIGGVLFKRGMQPVQFSCEVSSKMISRWLPRKSQIAMVELFATVVALETFKPWIRGSWTLMFVDSEPVQGSLVKGYSAKEDLCELVGIFWKLALELEVFLYVDRVPTDSNPADPPSRAQTEVGENLGWKSIEPVFPNW